MSAGYDVIVAGGGAAGLLCAGAAARRGRRVLVCEKMERPARKILVTGKGRCNVTNNCTIEELMRAVRTNARFLHSAFAGFSPQQAIALFEELGVPMKTERGGRVFPQSDRAMDIADALLRYAKSAGAEIRRETVEALWTQDGALRGIVGGKGKTPAESVVLATGGLSYPGTGSTGDGYRLALQAGHEVTTLRPSLIPIETRETWPREAMGLALRNITLTVARQGQKKPLFRELGELLFTHFGVSGPLVLSASAHMKPDAEDSLAEYAMAIDLKPGLEPEKLDDRLLRDFAQFQNREFRNALGELIPKTLIPVIVRLSGIPPEARVNSITKAQRQELAALIKALPLTPARFRPIEEAVITSGGVAVKHVDPKTMASKLLPGLFFAGELLDLDAYTGGFNLQIAFSTGYAAGAHC